MNNYLCANRHHFRSTSPLCPTPGCTAEVRPTKAHPLHDAAPDFKRLKPLTHGEEKVAPVVPPTARERSSHSGVATKHSCKWWVYESGNRVRWYQGCDDSASDATCSCGWDSNTGGQPLRDIERLVKDHKA